MIKTIQPSVVSGNRYWPRGSFLWHGRLSFHLLFVSLPRYPVGTHRCNIAQLMKSAKPSNFIISDLYFIPLETYRSRGCIGQTGRVSVHFGFLYFKICTYVLVYVVNE